MNQDPLTDGIELISAYDPKALLQAAGALQLLPENADRSGRLEAFAHAAANVTSRTGARPMNPSRLRRILSSYPFGEGIFAAMEDPFQNLFTDAFCFHGGSYVVFPGTCAESTFILRHVCKGLFLSSSPFPDSTFISQAKELVLAVLIISDEIASRAGLGRGVEPLSGSKAQVVVPSTKQFSRLSRAVSVSRQEVEAMLLERGVATSALEPFVLRQGTDAIYDSANGTLIKKPIVEIDSGYVVALPGALLPAAWSAVIRLAIEHGVADEVAALYNSAVWDTLTKSLDYLENHPLPLPRPQLPGIPCFNDGFFSLDKDKLMYAMLVTDPLTDYNVEEPFGLWRADGLADAVWKRVRAVEEWSMTIGQPANELLCLVLYHGMGRLFLFGLSDSATATVLPLGAGDLETISLLEAGNSLLLWKFAVAYERLRNSMRVHAWSVLDEFSLYRARGHSYYLGDDRKPNLLSVAPDGAGPLRWEAVRRRDLHCTLWHDGHHVMEVTTLFGSREIPVYVPVKGLGEDRGKYAAVLVDGFELLVWVVGPVYADESQASLHFIYVEFTETIAYWLWQFAPSLSSGLNGLSPAHNRVLVRLRVVPGDRWTRSGTAMNGDSETPVEVVSIAEEATVEVTLSHGLASRLQGPDNAGERYLMEEILRGLRDILQEDQQASLSNEAVRRIIDRHAPLGMKKKLVMIDTATNPQLDPRGLPTVRKVQDADENDLLDELGGYLSSITSLGEGPVPDSARTTVLNNAVLYYYTEMGRLVRSLNPNGLLEWLIAYQEALVRSSSLHRLTIPTRVACFSSEPEFIEKIRQEIPENSQAAIASRFVIEYVVSQPPQGIRPMSLSVYDRLQALASGILEFGFQSDLTHFELADIKSYMLRSGRLGVDRDEFARAREAYLPIFAAGEIARATRTFDRHWRTVTEAADKPPEALDIDAAAIVEFGFTVTELLSAVGQIRAIGENLDPVVPRVPLDGLRRQLEALLEWPEEKVTGIVELLSLNARRDFLEPPPPYTRNDVFPWRYNRSFSYIRRPIVTRERNGTIEALWGPKHLVNAATNLVSLCLSGRLQARSREMKELMGRFNNQRGEAFNDRVADLLETGSHLITKRRVKAVGKLKGAKGPPGDIDVLVADPRRRRLLAVECKDLAVARAPHELKNEILNLLEGQRGKPSTVEKHTRRAEWLRANLGEVLAWAGVPFRGKWKVIPMIVVDRELMGPHLRRSPIRIISFEELESELAPSR